MFFLCWGNIKTIDYFTISVWVVFHPPNLWGLRGIAPFERSTGEWILNTSRGELQGNSQMAIKIKGCPGKKIYSLYIVSHWLGFTIELPNPGRTPACGPRCDFRPLSTVTLQHDFSAGDGVPGYDSGFNGSVWGTLYLIDRYIYIYIYIYTPIILYIYTYIEYILYQTM